MRRGDARTSRLRWSMCVVFSFALARVGATSAHSYIKLEGVVPQGTVVATKEVATRLECAAVCVTVGCQAYTLTETSQKQMCTALVSVYELTYVALDPTFRVYSTQERLSALTTTTTPPPPCLDTFIASCYHG
ncbi:uncharacterized protein LOC122244350 [Penaeus japonicus]|uniref:uncharacterized protein LOC122244350 n=1 Tax=Penaeus japonicus TaxID=27405 RepID=UPI001C70F9BC|nr:uncharacterized protein LOC122244350 [Penaeus japonicus]